MRKLLLITAVLFSLGSMAQRPLDFTKKHQDIQQEPETEQSDEPNADLTHRKTCEGTSQSSG